MIGAKSHRSDQEQPKFGCDSEKIGIKRHVLEQEDIKSVCPCVAYGSVCFFVTPSFDLKKAIDDEIKQQQRLQRFDLPLKSLAQFAGNVTFRE